MRRQIRRDDLDLAVLFFRRNDSAAQYRAGGRDDLAKKEQSEIEIIASYLPAQLSDAELAAEVGSLIALLGASGAKDMGRVMKAAKEALGSSVDGKRLSEAVKAALK